MSADEPDNEERPALTDAMIAIWEQPDPSRAVDEDSLVVDVQGFEGPLDLLLAMARTQKVDLAQISVGELADQYLAFIAETARLRIELAADYLVIAAWLAYLKSRLLLPRDEESSERLSAEEMAQRLAFRLVRLDAMRDAAARLMTRKRLGRDVFARGMRDKTRLITEKTYSAEIYDLLKAYASRRQSSIRSVHVVARRRVWSIKDARRRLETLVGHRIGEWTQLDLFLEHYVPAPEETKTVLASSFGAALEMAREGLVEIRQERPFAPLYVRGRSAGTSGRGDAKAQATPDD